MGESAECFLNGTPAEAGEKGVASDAFAGEVAHEIAVENPDALHFAVLFRFDREVRPAVAASLSRLIEYFPVDEASVSGYSDAARADSSDGERNLPQVFFLQFHDYFPFPV